MGNRTATKYRQQRDNNAATMERAMSALANADAEAARWKAEYERACQTIADMHAAAVGEVTGPKRGVVEDVADLRAAYLRHLEGGE